MMKSTDKYGLYVVRPEDIGENEKYYLITATYCLLYTKKKPKDGFPVKNLTALPSLAKQWLNGAIESLRQEYLTENQQQLLAKGKAFSDALRQELEAERIRIKESEMTKDDAATAEEIKSE